MPDRNNTRLQESAEELGSASRKGFCHSLFPKNKMKEKELNKAAEKFAKCYHDGMAVRAGFRAGAEWRDRQLNWARDLVQAGIDKQEEAVNILKRLKELI